jgi:uncharacterized protein
MVSPTPLQSFLGGIGLSLPVHSLLLLNGTVFGISGFIHRSIRGSLESTASIAGLITAGVSLGLLEGKDGAPEVIPGGLSKVLVSGLLVGVGTKVSISKSPALLQR